MRALVPLALAMVVVGCTGRPDSPGITEQAPLSSTTLQGDYSAISSCAYRVLDRRSNPFLRTMLRKTDLPAAKQSVLSMVGDTGYRDWEVTITGTSPRESRVDITGFQTMWGADRALGDELLADVRTCS